MPFEIPSWTSLSEYACFEKSLASKRLWIGVAVAITILGECQFVCLVHEGIGVSMWFFWRRKKAAAPLSPREQEILARELDESRRQAPASPTALLGNSLGEDARTTAAYRNPSVPGSAYATGIPAQSLGEAAGK